MMDMRERIIVALDTDAHTALAIARGLIGRARWLKIGMTLYYSEGPAIVRTLREMGFEVFLDLKLHDIPHQVEGAAREVSRLGVSMITVHASGGADMMAAAVRGACAGSDECGLDTPAVLAVTVLTSMDSETLASTGVTAKTEQQVSRLAMLAKTAGVQGVVCSPQEASTMRELLGPERLIVTPGVRPPWSAADDQSRIATPSQSIEAGATHLVIGRPVTSADHPLQAFERIVEEG